jgi:hypothetical protein
VDHALAIAVNYLPVSAKERVAYADVVFGSMQGLRYEVQDFPEALRAALSTVGDKALVEYAVARALNGSGVSGDGYDSDGASVIGTDGSEVLLDKIPPFTSNTYEKLTREQVCQRQVEMSPSAAK